MSKADTTTLRGIADRIENNDLPGPCANDVEAADLVRAAAAELDSLRAELGEWLDCPHLPPVTPIDRSLLEWPNGQPPPSERWKCQAGKGDPPMDCDAPFCGCNPEWHKVIEALQESGWKSPQEILRMQAGMDALADADHADLRTLSWYVRDLIAIARGRTVRTARQDTMLALAEKYLTARPIITEAQQRTMNISDAIPGATPNDSADL